MRIMDNCGTKEISEIKNQDVEIKRTIMSDRIGCTISGMKKGTILH
jgi:hypothetical protein